MYCSIERWRGKKGHRARGVARLRAELPARLEADGAALVTPVHTDLREQERSDIQFTIIC